MKSKLVVIAMIAVSLAAGISSYFGREYLANALNEKAASSTQDVFKPVLVTANPITLNSEDVSQTNVGELGFVAGWALTSESDDFGGWSGFLLEDGSHIVAINDQGNWLKAQFSLTGDGPVTRAQMADFDQSGIEADKTDLDAESLVAFEGGYLVGFEQEHRIMAIAEPGTGVAELYDVGVDLSGLSNNSGIETMTLLKDNSLIMFAENGRDTNGRTKAWLSGATGARALDFMPPENYSPTDAATLPNGDVLLLLRHYSVMEGASAKLLHITANEIETGVVRGREIATIAKPLSVDNMEGLDVAQNADGSYRLYMISDDNFSSRQQTLLMVFDWVPAN